MYNLTDALNEWKRKSRLSGRPATQAEFAGIAEGYADSASNRLNAAKNLELQEQTLSNQADQFAQQMAFQKQQALIQQQLAEGALKADKTSDWTALAAGLGGAILSPAIEGLGESIWSTVSSFW